MKSPVRKIRIVKWLLIGLIILLIGLLTQWIYVQYKEEKRVFSAEVEIMIQSTVLQNKDQIFDVINEYSKTVDKTDSQKNDLMTFHLITDDLLDEYKNSIENFDSFKRHNTVTIQYVSIDNIGYIVDSTLKIRFGDYFNPTKLKEFFQQRNDTEGPLAIVLPLPKYDLKGYEYYLISQIRNYIIAAFFILLFLLFTFYMLYKNMYKQLMFTIDKDNMISNLSHELKTPVATTKIIIEALLNYNRIDDKEKTIQYLNIAHYEMERLEKIIETAITIMTSDDGKLILKFSKIDLVELFNIIIENLKPILEEKDITINFSPSFPSKTLFLDKIHIENAIYNILDNAIKYGGTIIDISIIELANENIEIRIMDNGIGILEEHRSKIFDKFYRVPYGDNHKVKGHGLGLNYTRHIIEAHGGTIELADTNDTCFLIKLNKLNLNI